MEYNRVLKQFGKIYIEVPAPDCARQHEFNLNHYSILGQTQLAALLQRTGFNIDKFNTFTFDVQYPADLSKPDGERLTAEETFYCIVATKQRPLDIK
jgi:hypothetical protein